MSGFHAKVGAAYDTEEDLMAIHDRVSEPKIEPNIEPKIEPKIEHRQLLDELKSHALDVLARCRQRGASAAEVSLSQSSGLNVNVRHGDIETLELTQDRGVSLTVYLGQRRGSASSADLSPESIEFTVQQALAIAEFTEADPYSGLADPDRLARAFPDLDLWHPLTLEAADAMLIAQRAEAAGKQADARISNSEGASVGIQRGFGVYANSHGFVGVEAGTSSSLSCALIAERDGQMQRDSHYMVSVDGSALLDPEALGREAARRTLSRLGARPLSTRKCPVLFFNESARSLFGHLVSAVSGGALYRRSSFLLDSAGQQLFPDWMRIHEQPHLRRALGSANYDQEGVATLASDLVSGGVLQRYVLGSYSARRLGLHSTGNAGGTHNLTISSNAGGLDELMQAMGTGLLVTEFLGQGINMVTGDYSRGIAGFWIEQGAIAFPVEEVTIAGNLREMFSRIVAVGNDIDMRGNTRCGSVWISELTVAGGVDADA